MVERRQLGLPQALHHSEDGGVDETDAQIGVCGEQLSDPCVVVRLELLDLERAPATVVEKPHEGIYLGCSIQQILDLDERRRRHNSILADALEQSRTRDVVVIAGLDCSENDAGI